MSDINSRDYWDTRFGTNWVSRSGREQSRFFARVAMTLMPDWLRHELAGATVCDWGCAMGDGTEVLAHALPAAHWTGIDFAASAVDEARRTVPSVEFACRDLLEEPGALEFDAVFSSNVLEHFREPMSVFARLGTHARRFQIHLVPFREPAAGREPEHEASFDWADLPLATTDGWSLAHASALDVTGLPDSYWHGEQILLVYARTSLVPGLRLDLALTNIESAATERRQREDRQVATGLREDLAAARAEARARAAESAAHRAAAAASAAAHQRTEEHLQAVLASRIWRWTAWLRGGPTGRVDAPPSNQKART